MTRAATTAAIARSTVILQLPIHGIIQGIVMIMLAIPLLSVGIDTLITISQPLQRVTTAAHPLQRGRPVTRMSHRHLAPLATMSIGGLPLRHTEMNVLLTTPITSRFLRLLEMRRTLLALMVV